MRYYLLDENKNPYQVSFEEGLKVYEDMNMKIVQQDRFNDDLFVSTVFLGLDHSFPTGTGTPILFETMIFGGPYDQYQERYTTYQDALEGHKRALEMANQPKTKDYENEDQH